MSHKEGEWGLCLFVTQVPLKEGSKLNGYIGDLSIDAWKRGRAENLQVFVMSFVNAPKVAKTTNLAGGNKPSKRGLKVNNELWYAFFQHINP